MRRRFFSFFNGICDICIYTISRKCLRNRVQNAIMPVKFADRHLKRYGIWKIKHFGGLYGGDAKGKASGAGAHRHHHAFARCAARCEKAVVGVPFAHGAVRRGLVVHGKARVSPAVPRGGFVHGRHRQRGKRRVQLRVLLQHRHGFAARAHVPVHTRKRALNGWHQAGARHGFYYSFAFGERSGGFQPVHAVRDGRECRKHVECPERRY